MKKGSLKSGTFFWTFISDTTNEVFRDPCVLEIQYIGKVKGIESYKIISIKAEYTNFTSGELYFDTKNDLVSISWLEKNMYDSTKNLSISAFLHPSSKKIGSYYGAVSYTGGLEGQGGYGEFKAKIRIN